MTLAQRLRAASQTFHQNDGFEADLLLLTAKTLEEASIFLLIEPINEASYMDLVKLLSEGAK